MYFILYYSLVLVVGNLLALENVSKRYSNVMVRKIVAISFRNIPFVQNGPSQPGGHLHTNDVLPLSLTQWPLFWHLNSVQGACLLHESPVNSLVFKPIFKQLHL